MPMAPMAKEVEAVALEALRAATLAAHHAAGLCRFAKLSCAARAARSGEAMLRSATALARAPASSAPPAAARPTPSVDVEGGVTEPRTSTKARRKRGKKKKKVVDVAMAPASLAAAALAPNVLGQVSAVEFDDSWADSDVGVVRLSRWQNAPAPVVAPPVSGGAGRELKLRTSRERTPPPKSRMGFAIGDFVEVIRLEKRSELNGTCGTIIELGGNVDRVAIMLVSSGCIRVKKENITSKLQDKGACRTSSSLHAY